MTIEIATEHIQRMARWAASSTVRVLSWSERPDGGLEICLAAGPLRVAKTWVIPEDDWWRES